MKKTFLPLLLLVLGYVASSCGGADRWNDQPYDVAPEATISGVLSDIAALSGLSFTIDPALQTALDQNPADLPTLTGLTAGGVLTLLQDTMPAETAFVYQQSADGNFLLRTRFEEKEDLTGTDPTTIVDFDPGLGTGAALISEPAFEEVCGGDAGTILDLLGSGGVFDIVASVVTDEGGHAEFIGTFPPSVNLEISGNELAISGEAPWVSVFGTIEDDGSFVCSGSGLVAGFPDVQVDFTGQATPEGISGTLTVGADGALPGGTPVVYNVTP